MSLKSESSEFESLKYSLFKFLYNAYKNDNFNNYKKSLLEVFNTDWKLYEKQLNVIEKLSNNITKSLDINQNNELKKFLENIKLIKYTHFNYVSKSEKYIFKYYDCDIFVEFVKMNNMECKIVISNNKYKILFCDRKYYPEEYSSNKYLNYEQISTNIDEITKILNFEHLDCFEIMNAFKKIDSFDT